MTRKTGAKTAAQRPLETALPFAVALGHRLRQAREDNEQTGEQVAIRARNLGLGWDRSTLTRIELGQRQLTAAELLMLPLLLGRALADLLPTEPVALTEAASVGPDELRRELTHTPRMRNWHLPKLNDVLDDALERMRPTLVEQAARYPDIDVLTVMQASDGWPDEPTGKAARRLGVDRWDVAVAAQQLWSRSLAAERDARLAAAGAADTARGRQGQRGHITRALLDELRPVVNDIGRARGDGHGEH